MTGFKIILTITLAGILWFGFTSCKHTIGMIDMEPDPMDTTIVIDEDTTNLNPCLPDVVYFEKDILPILTANCAYSGCHNKASAADDIVLDSYDNVMKTGKIKAFKPGDSDLYEVITESKDKDRMPPPPSNRLSTAQIGLIEKWITQGAKNETCNVGTACNTDNITYNNFINTLISNSGCLNCHNAQSQGGVRLDTYVDVKNIASTGRLVGSIDWQTGYVKMPLGGSKLNNCNISKVKSWINAGLPEN